MKILFACHRLPYPPKRGGKIRPFNIIRHLSEQGHQVTVATLARSEEEHEEGSGLHDYCDELLVGRIFPASALSQMLIRVPTTSPSTMGYFHSAALHRLVASRAKTQRFDMVFVHCSSAAQYVQYVHDTPSILDFGDMDSQKWLEYREFKPQPLATGYWLEGTKLALAEARLASRFDVCTCTTRAELETLRSMNAAPVSDWFPNGVDSDYFAPSGQDYDPDTIGFVGRMDYFPNQQAVMNFCRDVLPLVRRRRPAVRLVVVGAEPSRQIRALSDSPGVIVTGTVEDVRPHVRNAAATVAPLEIARGTQNKILESMAMGVPVVSSEVAAGGVDAEPGRHLLTAANPQDFADQVIRLLEDGEFRRRLSEAGRRRVLERHDWTASMRKLDGIISALLSRQASAASHRQAGGSRKGSA